jgi:hypothetical protein
LALLAEVCGQTDQATEGLTLVAEALAHVHTTGECWRFSVTRYSFPTEIALLVVAAKDGITREAIEVELPRLETLPFDAERKRMTVIRNQGGHAWAFVKGAPEVMLERCIALRTAKEIRALSDRVRMLQASARLPARLAWFSAWLSRPCCIDREGAAGQGRAVERVNGPLRRGAVRHLDEAKTPCTASLAVGHNPDGFYRAIRLEELAQVLLRRGKSQVAHKNVHAGFS